MRNIGIIDEATLNAVKAALDERVARLENEIERLHTFHWPAGDVSQHQEDAQRALVWAIAALHETKLAQEVFSEVRDEPEHPADATFATV